MNIFCNGEPRSVAPSSTLLQLLSELGLARAGVAAAVNDAVVPAARWESVLLTDGDRVLVIQAAQGG
jgi:sulfur carrier protein